MPKKRRKNGSSSSGFVRTGTRDSTWMLTTAGMTSFSIGAIVHASLLRAPKGNWPNAAGEAAASEKRSNPRTRIVVVLTVPAFVLSGAIADRFTSTAAGFQGRGRASAGPRRLVGQPEPA